MGVSDAWTGLGWPYVDGSRGGCQEIVFAHCGEGLHLVVMRIASLLASATEIVCALDLDDQLVAISHECDYPAHVLDRPRVSRPRFAPGGLSSAAIDAAVRAALREHGSVYDLDADALRAAAPDLLLTQDVCEVCAVPTSLARRASDLLDPPPRVIALDAHTVEEIFSTVRQVAEAAGVPDRAEPVLAGWRRRLAAVRDRVRDRTVPRVLCLEWLDPAFVPGHWGPEMIAWAGGRCGLGTPGARSQEVAWDAVGAVDPDVLVVAPCGYDLAAARLEADAHQDRLRAVAPRAVAAGRAFVLDGSAYLNRSGPRVVDGIEILAALFHPDVFDDVALAGRAARWSPLRSSVPASGGT